MTDAPRYRLVGYDIGTAPDENGGWVHWTDHEAEIARLTAERDAARAKAVKSRSTFPILNGNEARIDLQLVIDHGGQAKDNHGQTVNRLAERGGLSWCELYAVLHNKRWEKIDTNEAMIACRALEARYLAAIQPDPDARQADPAKAYGPILDLLPDAVFAAEKAMIKYPQPNYVISKWAEETGEVTKDLIHMAEGRQTADKLRGEIVQSLAMLHRLMVEGDQVHGLPPVGPAIRALTPPADLAAKIGGE